jgi:hypothetical protein
MLDAPFVDSCSELPPELRMSCPIRGGDVQELESIPDGVRLYFRAGSTTAARMRQVVGCQTALARVSAQAPALCPFLDAGTQKVVRERRGRVTVDLIEADRAQVEGLRERVRVAFPRAEH